MFGLRREDLDGADTIEVWPDNWRALDVFLAMQTQWRTGMGGATGLDYAALPTVMRLQGVRKRDREDVFAAVRIMEEAALDVIHEK